MFTIIGIATVKHIQQLANTKRIAFENIDVYDSLRAALSVLRYDLGQAFHVRYDDLGEENRKALLRNEQVAHTLFDGRKEELIFTSLSHRNFYADRRESEQTEISYFLHTRQGAEFPSLMKRESSLIDEDLYSGGKIYRLLDGVMELRFQFFDGKEGKWVEDWGSDGGNYLDRFPLAVRVYMLVAAGKSEPIPVETTIKISYPNNRPYLVQLTQ